MSLLFTIPCGGCTKIIETTDDASDFCVECEKKNKLRQMVRACLRRPSHSIDMNLKHYGLCAQPGCSKWCRWACRGCVSKGCASSATTMCYLPIVEIRSRFKDQDFERSLHIDVCCTDRLDDAHIDGIIASIKDAIVARRATGRSFRLRSPMSEGEYLFIEEHKATLAELVSE